MAWSQGVQIKTKEIDGKVLDIIIPIGSGTPEQMRAISDSIGRAKRLGVHILITRN